MSDNFVIIIQLETNKAESSYSLGITKQILYFLFKQILFNIRIEIKHKRTQNIYF